MGVRFWTLWLCGSRERVVEADEMVVVPQGKGGCWRLCVARQVGGIGEAEDGGRPGRPRDCSDGELVRYDRVGAWIWSVAAKKVLRACRDGVDKS